MSASEAVAAGTAWRPLSVSFPVLALDVGLLLWLSCARVSVRVGAATASAVSYTIAGLAMLVLNGAHRTTRARYLLVGLVAGRHRRGVLRPSSRHAGLTLIDAEPPDRVRLALTILLRRGRDPPGNSQPRVT